MQARTGFFLASALCALMVAAPMGAFGRDSKKIAATFNDRYPAEETAPPPAAEPAPTRKAENVVRATRVVTAKRPRSRVVVRYPFVPRCWYRGIARANANSSIMPSRRPSPRWTWSPIPAVLSRLAQFAPARPVLSPRVTEFSCPLFSRGSAQPFERIPIG